ncbi:MAG: hypothetical protein ABH856_03350, partial [Patescibacteria group bacterium]
MATKPQKANLPHRQANGNSKHPKKMFEFKLQFNLKNIVTGLLIAFIVLSVIGNLANPNGILPEQPFTTTISDIKDKKVSTIEVEDSK